MACERLLFHNAEVPSLSAWGFFMSDGKITFKLEDSYAGFFILNKVFIWYRPIYDNNPRLKNFNDSIKSFKKNFPIRSIEHSTAKKFPYRI